MEVFCPGTHHSPSTTINIEIPHDSRIGVFVSGGIDSTILYYLVLKKCLENNNTQIFPIVIMRKEGSRHFAKPVIAKINQLLNVNTTILRLGDTTLPESQQVTSAVKQAFVLPPYMNFVYVGVINNLPEHLIGFEKIVLPDHQPLQFPFKDLYKYEVIDLYYKFGVDSLLQYTHSCDISEIKPCGTCNGCRERQWGFLKIGRIDPCIML